VDVNVVKYRDLPARSTWTFLRHEIELERRGAKMSQDLTGIERSQGQASLLSPRRQIVLNADFWTWLLVAVGVVLQVLEYADNRPLYMDEDLLLSNLVGLPILDFSTTLSKDQLAAPGFLVVERIMVRLPMPTVWSARLIPLLCGIASMFLMRSVARHYLSPRAVPMAVGLFALDDWLIYYAVEIKQYCSDTTLTLVALLLASAAAGLSRRSLLILAVFGVVGVWFSHPLAMVLGAVGTYLAAKAGVRRDWKKMSGVVATSVLWAGSFAACYLVSYRILSKEKFIWNWWDFAFLPIPPRSLADLSRDFWQIINIFNSPAWVVTPLGVLFSAFLAMALYLIGSLSLGLRWRGGLYLLVAPLLFTLAASALHQYPFHGRLLLFLVPTVHLLVAEGAEALTRRGGVILTVALGVFLLVQPACHVLWHRLVSTRVHGGFDSHGDLLPDLLDHLEQRERAATKARGRKSSD
jgi:Dolichyl-phosphate-mannose-protein mannosyltransferase